MSPTFNYVLGQTFLLSILGIFWLLIGVFIFKQFFVRGRVAIREKGFRLEGAIDLNPDRYEQPASYSISAGSSLVIRNSTMHTVRISPLRSGDPIMHLFRLQRFDAKAPSPEASASEIVLAAGQSGWLTFELGGDYDITVHHLDGAAFLYDHLIVHVSAAPTPKVVITEQGFLVTNTIADLRSVSYTLPMKYSTKADSQVRFKNLTPQAVYLCLGQNGVCTPQVAGPEELCSGLTLAPGQSASIAFELEGDYDITTHRLDGAAFPSNHLIVHVSAASTPKVVITEQGFLITKTIADLHSASYTLPAKYSIHEDSQVRFKNLTDQPVRLCLGQNGVCNPQAAGPEALRSGLTLAPGQSAGVTFSRVGDYDITAYAPDHPPFSYPQLVVHVEDSD